MYVTIIKKIKQYILAYKQKKFIERLKKQDPFIYD
jgi:hypothetical protein